MTTSSEQSQQSDHGSRSSSYGSLQTYYHSSTREPGKGEINDRFRAVLVRAVEFVTTADDSTLASSNELQLSKRIFSILLHGLSNPFERKHSWGGVWSSRATLRKYTARIMVWLLAPQQSISTRIYAVRSLLEEPKAREILAFLLDVHPQVGTSGKKQVILRKVYITLFCFVLFAIGGTKIHSLPVGSLAQKRGDAKCRCESLC